MFIHNTSLISFSAEKKCVCAAVMANTIYRHQCAYSYLFFMVRFDQDKWNIWMTITKKQKKKQTKKKQKKNGNQHDKRPTRLKGC